MTLVFAAALFLAAYYWTFLRLQPANRLNTFVIDPPTMLVVGIVSVMVGLLTRRGRRLTWEQFKTRRRRVGAFQMLFLAGFWTFELLTYFNVLGHPFDPSKSGNDFMVNGYVEWLTGPIYGGPFPIYDHWWSWPLLAAMLLLQYGALRLGNALGYMTAYFNDMDRWTRRKPA